MQSVLLLSALLAFGRGGFWSNPQKGLLVLVSGREGEPKVYFQGTKKGLREILGTYICTWGQSKTKPEKEFETTEAETLRTTLPCGHFV